MKWVVESSPAAVTRRSGKTATFSAAAITRRRGAGWRWGTCQGLHPQVRAARGGSSSHLSIYHELRLKLYYLLIINS
ncbi:unnamed protein product [Spirodela intermedia]|uniref:Uncharacterized protein n=1 Tax=Spirodela intermedia TaxID=51605 RepID=A0A7I8KXM8_SPIIN|nr:unnamed protein product [Spirodela intermedia]